MGWLLRLVTGGPTNGRGPPTVLFYFKSEGRGAKKVTGGPGWLRYASGKQQSEELRRHAIIVPSGDHETMASSISRPVPGCRPCSFPE